MRQTPDDAVTEMDDMEMDEDRELDDEVNISEMLDEEIPVGFCLFFTKLAPLFTFSFHFFLFFTLED